LNLNYRPIEFLRTFSSLGVVWIHVWTYFNNVQLKFFGIDFFKAISFVGNGVDFFFVISGFLMFLAWNNKYFSAKNYWRFMVKRLFRIVPLYYLSILIYYFVFTLIKHKEIHWSSILINATFLNNYFNVNIAHTYWSLAVEWIFYLIIPFLFIFKDKKKRFFTFIVFLIIALFRLTQVEMSSELFLTPNMPIPLFFEFGWGMLIGMVMTNHSWNERIVLKQSWSNLIIGFSILYFGRFIRLTEVIQLTGDFGIILKVLSGPVMTFGFAYVMFMLISSKGIFSKFVEHQLFQFTGRLSYGIYLWHLLILSFLDIFFKPTSGPLVMFMAFLIVIFFSTFFAYCTYHLVEKPYFKSKLSSKIS
jgi:peptidoglycan/LPS O-acetylase OafA/YrhL